MVIADLDLQAISRRKLRMDSVGHYARPDVVRLLLDPQPQQTLEEAAFGPGPNTGQQASPPAENSDLTARIVALEEELRRLKGE
jgi:aliphatic nitrilase